jgi:short-subunit dehydrogenase
MTDGDSKSPRPFAVFAFAGLAATAGWIGWRRRQSPRTNQLSGSTLLPGRALITGASSGIGEAYARRLAAEGYDLTLVARREDRLRALAAELSAAHGIAAEVLAADLARRADIDRVANHIQAMPDLVLLINNAGFGTRGDFAEAELDRQIDMINVHIIATVSLTHAALPGLTARGRGAIINVSSVAAFFPSPGGTTYSATKVYLNNFSEALNSELAGTGISVQALCPGFTYSEFHDTPEYADFSRDQIPAALWMTAEQVVGESLAALGNGHVIIVPGKAYQGLVLTANSPFGGTIRRAARAVRRRFGE